jgi:hypothetical protein
MAPTKIAFINKIFLVVAAFCFLTVIPSNSAVAIPIDIKPSHNNLDYTGTYRVNGGATVTGATTVELPPGQHLIVLASPTVFHFSVAANGDVTSHSAAAKGDPRTLTFNTIEVEVVPGAYTGTYYVSGVDTRAKAGRRPFVVVRDVGNYVLAISPSASFRFHVDDNGAVTCPSAAAEGGPKTLTFNTTTVEVDPGGYTGTYYVSGVDTTRASGTRTFVLMPGVGGYVLVIVPGVNPPFKVDAYGVPDPSNIPVTINDVTYTFLLRKDATLTVGIDIKPGEFPNVINPKRKGKIWVAILSTATFDATTVVDRDSVRFGKTGTEAGAVQSKPKDADQDGDEDLWLHFETDQTDILCGDIAAMIKGRTSGTKGIEIEGSDSIETRGC